ncbi:MAG: DUF4292 domain-containing protein [Prevotellaceae bacterium]|jgi:hypothetical protein|nr:DUF4292 domain-containing protein [Prevotellaceae bacterium]
MTTEQINAGIVMKRRNYLLWTVAMVCLLGMCGCKSRQQQKALPSAGVELQSAETLVKNILVAQPDYNTINISQMEALVTWNERTFSLRCNVKAVRNENITISILPMLGIEMYRIILTPKTFTILDKLNRQYCENSYDFLTKELNISLDFESVQALLTAQLFSFDGQSPAVLKKTFVAETHPDKYSLTALKQVGNKRHRFDILPSWQIAGTALSQNGLDIFTFSYGNYTLHSGVSFPTTLSAKVITPQRTVSVDFKVNKIDFNKPANLSETDLSRYSSVTCNKLLP